MLNLYESHILTFSDLRVKLLNLVLRANRAEKDPSQKICIFQWNKYIKEALKKSSYSFFNPIYQLCKHCIEIQQHGIFLGTNHLFLTPNQKLFHGYIFSNEFKIH